VLNSIKNKISSKLTYRPSLRLYVTFIFVIAISISAALIAYKAFKTLYEGTLRDAWTILFLDLEKQSHLVARDLKQLADKSLNSEPTAQFLLAGNGSLKSIDGVWDQYKTIQDLGLDEQQLNPASGINYAFTTVKGEFYLARLVALPGGQTLQLFKTNFGSVTSLLTNASKKTVLYLSNRSGHLLFSNTSAVTPANLMARPLVASFVQVPFSQGQTEFTLGKESFYGFHQELAGTNLILFAEKSKKRTMENLYAAVKSVSKSIALIFIVALVVLQIPLTWTSMPLKKLSIAAMEVSQGQFYAQINRSGVGELRTLTSTFGVMLKSLQDRDQEIKSTHELRLRQMQVDNDLKISKAIEDYFLCVPQIDLNAGIRVNTVYIPGIRCHGVWIGSHYFNDHGETIMSLVEMTNDTTSSTMMTPIISHIFSELIQKNKHRDPIEFLVRCNEALYAYGKGKITANGLIAKFHKGAQKIECYSAGTLKPIILENGKPLDYAASAQHVTHLGSKPELHYAQYDAKMTPGTQCLFYSSSLTRNAAQEPTSHSEYQKNLMPILSNLGDAGVKDKIAELASRLEGRASTPRSTVDFVAIGGVIL
jgi:hypothetical protein